MKSLNVNTIIVGASASGLSCAAQLKKRNISYAIFDKSNKIGSVWANHYDRLHLHTFKSRSHLPFLKFPKTVAKYPSRDDVVDYLKSYAKYFSIEPQLDTEVLSTKRIDDKWMVCTSQGDYSCNNIIICTGNNNSPKIPSKNGISSFTGDILHTSAYRSGKEFKGKRVLVIGFGNSACEIAMCLHENGAKSNMSVRSPVNVIPRELARNIVIEKLRISDLISYKILDKVSNVFIKNKIGDITRYGLKKLPYGPIEQIIKHHNVPLIDIGTYDLIKSGNITIYGDIKSIVGDMIHFEGGFSNKFDAIIMGTGYENRSDALVELNENRMKDIKLSISKRKYFGENNIYFCGFHVSPLGMLREIRKESKVIVKAIAKRN